MKEKLNSNKAEHGKGNLPIIEYDQNDGLGNGVEIADGDDVTVYEENGKVLLVDEAKLDRTDGFVVRPGFTLNNVSGHGEKCMTPAITKFPPPLIGKKARQYGGVIVHILVAVYMFIGLAIICDDYFVPALDRISEGIDIFASLYIIINVSIIILMVV